jgi:hypothetical protein
MQGAHLSMCRGHIYRLFTAHLLRYNATLINVQRAYLFYVHMLMRYISCTHNQMEGNGSYRVHA